MLNGLRAAKGVTKLAGVLREALFMKGLLEQEQMLQLKVIVEQSGSGLTLYSAYNVDGDRGWIQNDSQRVYDNTP
ncbi:hypothetical protein ACFOD1_02610 [Pseudidiomarina halophila]|uniref:Uncharacterized protein n=1 Tax=Pseudidiomarina halophila TaxID=1449799 RepID=A0A432XWQ8_9GAMM|nr:hypothetical protein [Pseudidiomarina halophila]RUO53160.1 hypothetical protein CWI69_09065 [Pseudidiomarina halophila]